MTGSLSRSVELRVSLQWWGGEDGSLGQHSAVFPVCWLGEAGALCRAELLLQQVEEPLLCGPIHRAINNSVGTGIQQVPMIN